MDEFEEFEEGIEDDEEEQEERDTGAFPFFQSLGMDPDRNLAKACADFYLLERMVADGYRPAVEPLRLFEKQTAREFATYLDMAVGGEVRHAGECESEFGVTIPRNLIKYIQAARDVRYSRSKCWKIWSRMRYSNRESVQWFVDCETVFNDELWPHEEDLYLVGGPSWATASRVVFDYMTEVIKPRTFIDRCFTLQHNYGAIFDKVYKVRGLNTALEIQKDDNYQNLSRLASRPVKSMWDHRNQLASTAAGARWIREQRDLAAIEESRRCKKCGRIRSQGEILTGGCLECLDTS